MMLERASFPPWCPSLYDLSPWLPLDRSLLLFPILIASHTARDNASSQQSLPGAPQWSLQWPPGALRDTIHVSTNNNSSSNDCQQLQITHQNKPSQWRLGFLQDEHLGRGVFILVSLSLLFPSPESFPLPVNSWAERRPPSPRTNTKQQSSFLLALLSFVFYLPLP